VTPLQESSSPAETERIAAALAAALSLGDMVLVEGELGAGKTTFVRGACRALGVRATVSSPTFTIGQRYPGPVPVAHVDLYRIKDLSAEDPDLLTAYIGPETITFIEWPERFARELEQLGRVAAHVRLEHGGGDRRIVRVASRLVDAAA